MAKFAHVISATYTSLGRDVPQTATDSTTPPNTGDVDYPGSIGTTGAAAAGGAGHVVVLF